MHRAPHSRDQHIRSAGRDYGGAGLGVAGRRGTARGGRRPLCSGGALATMGMEAALGRRRTSPDAGDLWLWTHRADSGTIRPWIVDEYSLSFTAAGCGVD